MKAWLFTAVVVLAGCSKKGDGESSSNGQDATTPRFSMSSQPWRTSGTVGGSLAAAPPSATVTEPDPVARSSAAGRELHADVAKGCSDQKCFGEKCGPLCVRFMDEKYKTFTTVSQRNRVYFACFGACLGGSLDGGK